MKKRRSGILLSLAAAILLLFMTAISASALSDSYRFDEFGMTVKVPKNYYVITRDTPADDPVFASLQLNRDDVMSSFQSADIYLRAYDPDGIFQLSLTVTRSERSEAIGNYADLSDAERREILDNLLASVPSATEVKRGDYIFFESSRESGTGDDTLYINQSNTVVNGLQIDLTLSKTGEPILPGEAKVLISLASSIEFDQVESAPSGPLFDWWRLLLWVGILAALTAAISLSSRHRSEVRRRRLEERRRKRAEAEEALNGQDSAALDDRQVSFDEALGYDDEDRFSSRAGTDLDTFDINVEEKDPNGGMNYFEDGGKSIDDRSGDYFDTYFKEPTPSRSGISRLFATIGAYIGIAFRHVGYFFRNLFRSFKREKKQ